MPHSDLALKSAEIEELADLYFFRPVGLVVARTGRALGLTPIGLTLIAAVMGIAGGACFFDERLGIVGFLLLILHSIVDSADGQLARLTGRVTEFGRALDGISGYATHVTIFVALAAGFVHRGSGLSVLIWMLLAGISAAIHAGLYDYYRHAYITVVQDGRVPGHAAPHVPTAVGWLFRIYLTFQRWIVGPHSRVEASLKERSTAAHVREEDRVRYRENFYPLVRGWNFLGDNTRFFVIGVLALLHRMDLFFAFILVAMNIAFAGLWLWQRNADRRFLASPSSSKLPAE